VGAGATIEDDQRAVVAPHLNTRRVAAVAQRDSTRLGQGSAGTPKPDIHPCTLARHRGAAPRTVGTPPLPVEDKAYQRQRCASQQNWPADVADGSNKAQNE